MKKKFLIGFSLTACTIGFMMLSYANNNPIVRTNYMSEYMGVGRYEFATAGGANTRHCDSNLINCNSRTGDPVRLPGDTGGRYMGTAPDGSTYGNGGNSSSSILSKPSANAKVVKAFLVEKAFIYSPDTAKTLTDHPMRLVGPNGGTTYSKPMNNWIYTANPYQSHNNHVTTTVTDITSFVQSQGFGKYEGWDIPYWNRGANGYQSYDMTAAWELIVICEDESLPLRMLRLKYGAIDYSSGRVANVTIDGAGIRTKTSGNVTGQLLISAAGGDANSSGSYMEFQPSPNFPYYNLSTGKSGEVNKANNFLEGLSSVNGVIRSDVRTLANRGNDGLPFHNNDLILLDINSNKSNTQNGHNAYYMNDSSSIAVKAHNVQTNNTITALGMIADIDTAMYASSISHAGQAWQGIEYSMSAHIENNTNTNKMNLGMSGGYALINVDKNITINKDSIVAKFYDKSTNKTYSLPSNMISVNGNQLKVIYGVDVNGISQVGDKLDVSWKGTPKTTGNYTNTLKMEATGIISEDNVSTNMETTNITSAKDSFNAKYNNPPTISGTDKIFYEGEYTEKHWQDTVRWQDMDAKDVEDGNLKSKVKIVYDNTKVNVPGTYKVTYSVTDSFGKTATKDIKVTVKYNNPPVITGKDKTFYENEYSDKQWKDTIRWNDMNATDVEDGNLKSKVKITYDNTLVKVAGTYKVTYSVTDKFGKTATKDIKVTVKYNNPPTITGEDRWFYESEDVTNTRLLERVKANDIEDGNISNKAVIKSSNVQNHVIGTYKVTYKITDAFGKSAETTVNVYIKGGDPEGEDGDNTIKYVRHINKKYIETLNAQSVWRTSPELWVLLNDSFDRQERDDPIAIWEFTSKDTERVKAFNAEHGFSKEANEKFLEEFSENKLK